MVFAQTRTGRTVSLAIFILMPSPDASAARLDRMLTMLAAAFPQHEFIAGDADDADHEDTSIMAVYGSADDLETVELPTADDVTEVEAALKAIQDDLKGWKPS